MSYPKIQPCPQCGTAEDLGVYAYDHGWKHVECNNCFYLGPGEGSIRRAIKSHNAKVTLARSAASEGQTPIPILSGTTHDR